MQGIAAIWVEREVGSTFSSKLRVWVVVTFTFNMRDKKHATNHTLNLFFFLFVVSLQFKVFSFSFNNYELKRNDINITDNSFNSSTSPWAIKHDILLAQPHFYNH